MHANKAGNGWKWAWLSFLLGVLAGYLLAVMQRPEAAPSALSGDIQDAIDHIADLRRKYPDGDEG